MLKKKTTLVLGAGASLDFGYPLGLALREEILSGMYRMKDGASSETDAFTQAFRRSQLESIDAFLAHRSEFSEVGKWAIAAVLLNCEDEDLLFRAHHEDGWCRYLLSHITSSAWGDLDLSMLSIVTFNYDRSFEHLLMHALMSRYGVSQGSAIDKIRTMEIVHVYGTLGACLPDEPNYRAYGGNIHNIAIQHAAGALKVIPDGRDEAPELVKARRLLEEADAIAFLGFGFDTINLQRLHSSQTCVSKRRVQTANGGTNSYSRPIVATCLGMTSAEAYRAFQSTAGSSDMLGHQRLPPQFLQTGCRMLLRETLILG